MAAKKIEFTAQNVKAFSSWLKKFTSTAKSLLLEIDENESIFFAKTYNEERSVVKFSKIKFEDAGLTVKPSKNPRKIKVGIYNISRLMNIINQFDNKEFSFIINYDEIVSDVNEYIGISLILKNVNLKMTIECISINVFKYISDDLFRNNIATFDNIIPPFSLSSENVEQINSLCSLDNEYNFMEFKSAANIYVCGKIFDFLVEKRNEEWNGKENSINIFKEQFKSIDDEDYGVEMGEDRLMFTSSHDLSTVTVISMVEKD
jgi:hypothetical protein